MPKPSAEGEAGEGFVQRTDDEAQSTAASEPSPEQAPEEEAETGPDTESIARQVYAIIKRRLAVERERAGFR